MEIVLLFLIPILTALFCLIPRSIQPIGCIQCFGMALFCGFGLWVIQKIIASPNPLHYWGNWMYLDAISGLMIVLICLLGFLASIYATGYMANEVEERIENLWKLKGFYGLFNLFILTMLMVVTTNSIGLLWVGIEATTLVSAFLVGYYNKQSNVEAAWKYIILCTVGIVFAFIGIILVYTAVTQAGGNKALGLSWDYLITIGSQLNPKLIKVAFIFILVGYGTKAGLAPMHTWLPDAHSEAPTPVSALLSGVLLKCALYGILRFSMIANLTSAVTVTQPLLITFGLISLIIAAGFILVQRNIKRLLAYSSLEHVGIITLGLGFGSPLAVFGALFHMINHGLAKSLMFFSAGNLTLKYRTKDMERVQGAFQLMPLSSVALLVGGLALAGSPPFSLFISEFYILYGGIKAHHWVASILLLLFLIIIFGGLTYHFGRMVIGPQPTTSPSSQTIPKGEINRSGPIAVLIPLALILLLAWWIPAPLLHLLNDSVRLITGGHL